MSHEQINAKILFFSFSRNFHASKITAYTVYHHINNVELSLYCVLITCSITIQDTKQRISKLVAVEEEKRKTQPYLLSSSSEEETDDSVDTTQGNCLFSNIDT